MASVTISAKSLKKSYGYGEAIDLEVQVKNGTAKRVFVITDPYIWSTAANRIDVRLAETAPSPGLGYYDYNPPQRRGVAAGQTVAIHVQIGMPPREGSLDSKGFYFWQVDPVAGDVTVAVTLGYLRGPFRPVTSAPWAEFLEAQQLARTKQAKVHVDPR